MGGRKESQDQHETRWRESLSTHAEPAITDLWKETTDYLYHILLAFIFSDLFHIFEGLIVK